MARKKANRGSGIYARPVTIGNGTLSYEANAVSAVQTVTVRDVLLGCGLLAPLQNYTSTSGSTTTVSTTPVLMHRSATGVDTYESGPSGFPTVPAGDFYLIPKDVYEASYAADAVKISSVTVGPNSGTRLPAEVNFFDGQLFRCDNAMKPTKVRPSAKTPAGLWHDTTDLDFPLFTIKGSNTANPYRVGVSVRQF